MSITILRTDDGRWILLPRMDALWVLSAADILDCVVWWHAASGLNQQPQPFLMPRDLYLGTLPRVQ